MQTSTPPDDTPLMHAKTPASPVAGPYGHPFHPIAVTIPIGAWIAVLVFDIAALSGFEREPFTIAAAWLIAIGVIGAVLAAVFGLMDFTRIVGHTQARRTALIHMTINLAVVVLFVVNFFVHLASPADGSVAGLILTIVALLALGVSGWLGGRLAYHFGVRVADERTQAEGFAAA